MVICFVFNCAFPLINLVFPHWLQEISFPPASYSKPFSLIVITVYLIILFQNPIVISKC